MHRLQTVSLQEPNFPTTTWPSIVHRKASEWQVCPAPLGREFRLLMLLAQRNSVDICALTQAGRQHRVDDGKCWSARYCKVEIPALLAFWICHLYMTCSHETKQPVHWSRGSLEFGDIAYTSSVLSYTASQSLGCIMTYHDYILLPTQVLHFRSFCFLNLQQVGGLHTCFSYFVHTSACATFYILIDYTVHVRQSIEDNHSKQGWNKQTNKHVISRDLWDKAKRFASDRTDPLRAELMRAGALTIFRTAVDINHWSSKMWWFVPLPWALKTKHVESMNMKKLAGKTFKMWCPTCNDQNLYFPGPQILDRQFWWVPNAEVIWKQDHSSYLGFWSFWKFIVAIKQFSKMKLLLTPVAGNQNQASNMCSSYYQWSSIGKSPR